MSLLKWGHDLSVGYNQWCTCILNSSPEEFSLISGVKKCISAVSLMLLSLENYGAINLFLKVCIT